MMFYQLPPAGNPINLSATEQPELFLQSFFSPYQSRYFASGTAALAAAITAAIRSKNVVEPEVLIPAYGCPDLVSAAVFAGAKPVLVDLAPDRPWMDIGRLPEKISSQTVAIIATNLLGIPERMEKLRPIAEQAGAVLIEDSAQAFPYEDEPDIWEGDLIVLSFGRGKPVSLLGGGAVLFRETLLGDLLPAGRQAQQGGSRSKHALFRLKARLYNRMVSPRLYWIPQNLPFLHLGETRYYPLPDIDAIDQARLAALPANITAYQHADIKVQQALAEMFRETDAAAIGQIDLPRACQLPPERRILRYPLLVDSAIRDRLYRQLHKFGSGPSIMYPATLPGISGLEMLLSDQGPFNAAEAFAARILTLPTHRWVSADDIAIIRRTLDSA